LDTSVLITVMYVDDYFILIPNLSLVIIRLKGSQKNWRRNPVCFHHPYFLQLKLRVDLFIVPSYKVSRKF